MPLKISDAMLNLHSDPNIVLGPHKCCPTECLLKNGDPLANKKVRMAPASATNLEMTDDAPPHHAKEKNLGCVPDSIMVAMTALLMELHHRQLKLIIVTVMTMML